MLDVLLTLNKQASNIERIRISLHAANERLAHLNEAAEQSQLDWERQLEGHESRRDLPPLSYITLSRMQMTCRHGNDNSSTTIRNYDGLALNLQSLSYD